MSGSPAREIAHQLRESVGVQPAKLKEVKPAELAVRFAFGAGIAILAGLVGMRFGPRLGGLFLAFPAVLPASLTLLERKDGRDKADVDALGAILGSCGLLAFAIAMVIALPRLPALVPVAAGAVAWVLTSLALFLAVRAALRRKNRAPR
ncbi:MAG: DUF3147 family protein [Candidatus Dormibacteraeota bacterium]|nr:DUF3147 family protein [Candidatus Dormibacteraeota bacterium]